MKNKLNIIDASEEIMSRLFNLISEPSGGVGYRIDHSLRVKRYLEIFLTNSEIGDNNLDKEVLISAGILHDIGDLARVKNSIIDYSSNIDHAKTGTKYIREELSKFNFEDGKISKICKIIEGHHDYGFSTDIETKLVQDADLLDEVGVINIWQMFSYSANKQRSLDGTLDYWLSEGAARKIECIKKCNFAFTKRYARDRFNKLNEFMTEIIREKSGADLNDTHGAMQ